MTPRGGCWPTAEQTDLLRAALLRGPEGVQAWQRWKATALLGRLDAASVRLLGQLWRNLQKNGVDVDDRLLEAFRQYYRRTWYGNHLRLRDAGVVLVALRDRGIEPMLLKGAALVVGYYGDAGARPMEDVDILVRGDDAVAAAASLRELGWIAPQAITPRHIRATHAMAFTGPRGGQVDLHWHLLPESCWAGADAPLWERSAVLGVAGVDVRVMEPADQLFHCCAHGVRWEPVTPLRWIADAAMVLARAPDLDWDRVAAASERHQLTLPVGDALDYLRSELGLAVPPRTVERLRGVRVSASDRLAHRWRTRPAGRFVGRLPEHWLRYRRLRGRRRTGEPSIGFVDYLEVTFGCAGLWSLARRGLGRRRWRREAAAALDDYERDLTAAGLGS
jgi:hypothetical protein